jgi:hypothetical protein
MLPGGLTLPEVTELMASLELGTNDCCPLLLNKVGLKALSCVGGESSVFDLFAKM